MATKMPTKMIKAYARSGIGPSDQTPLAGLGIEVGKNGIR
jgi:hypothetical protein